MERCKLAKIALCVIILNLFIMQGLTGTATADVTDTQLAEVNHLINYVKNSNCVLNRNGTEHLAENSAEHIKRKYNYFKNKIKSTEDFIKYSATKSTMSGEYYTVVCPGQEELKTRNWLLNELELFRSNNITAK